MSVNVVEAFRKYDRDRDGFINLTECQQAYNSYAISNSFPRIPMSQFNEYFKNLKKDKIDLMEFTVFANKAKSGKI